MGGKERIAVVVVIAMLALGILIDVLDRGEARHSDADPTACGPVDSCGGPESRFMRLDINRATVEELVSLPGIGPKRAAAIEEWRSTNGAFQDTDQLVEVKGIGSGTLERIRFYICTDTSITHAR
jgi:competence protein ComEA